MRGSSTTAGWAARSVAALAALAGLAGGGATAAATTSPAPVVTTDRGAVRGVGEAGVESFRGIPYAAPPVGRLRWQAPNPARRWQGVRPAEEFGNVCPVLPSTNGPRSETEDCLFLNVQRPAGMAAGDDVPVFVFFHGGGFTNGSGNQHDMSKIVSETGVIGVSLNYRLGVLGFLGHPGLATRRFGTGNYGFMDQQAALHWVQRNIAAFGGDPAAVTIGGESAGAFSVCGHLSSPRSRGLFSRAVMQSGSCPSRPTTEDQEIGGIFAAEHVGCPDPATAVRCLRGKTTAQLLDASEGFPAFLAHGTPALPEPPREAAAAGRLASVPLLVGWNRDEARTFAKDWLIGRDRAFYEEFVRGTSGSNAAAVLARYPWPATSDEFTTAYLISAIDTDTGLGIEMGGCPGRDLLDVFERHTSVHAYEFAHRSGPGLTEIPGYEWGAGHAVELPYLWPSFHNGTPIAPTFDEGERRLADDMVQYWGAFVRAGDPAVPSLLDWPRYSARRGATMQLHSGGEHRVIGNRLYDAEHQCAFWESLPEPEPEPDQPQPAV